MKERGGLRIGEKLSELRASGKKALALLIDPDKDIHPRTLVEMLPLLSCNPLSFVLIGGSLITSMKLDFTINSIREASKNLPIVLFPGSVVQLTEKADAILFLSLISGRNPEFLIGQHVVAAPLLAEANLEVLPTGYMLVDGGKITSVHYMSQSVPLPNDKPELAVATALAGFYLGLKYLYLEAGSGAEKPVSQKLISEVSERVPCPLIVGGGIDTFEKAKATWQAGADVVVIGNKAEKNPDFLIEALHYAEAYNLSLNVN